MNGDGGGRGGKGGTNNEGTDVACYPYHVCFLTGSYSPMPSNAGIGSARAFVVRAIVMGRIGMSFLWFLALYRLSLHRFERSPHAWWRQRRALAVGTQTAPSVRSHPRLQCRKSCFNYIFFL